MSDRQDEYSMMSFRPSSYSTGIQPVQPYTPIWPEGTEYGSYLPDWLRWERTTPEPTEWAGPARTTARSRT